MLVQRHAPPPHTSGLPSPPAAAVCGWHAAGTKDSWRAWLLLWADVRHHRSWHEEEGERPLHAGRQACSSIPWHDTARLHQRGWPAMGWQTSLTRTQAGHPAACGPLWQLCVDAARTRLSGSRAAGLCGMRACASISMAFTSEQRVRVPCDKPRGCAREQMAVG